jgi:hypothetical protein
VIKCLGMLMGSVIHEVGGVTVTHVSILFASQ